MSLSVIWNVHKTVKREPHELNDRHMERRQSTRKILFARQKKSHFSIGLWQAMKSKYISETLNAKKLWLDPGQPSTISSRQNRLGRKPMLCVWWDQQSLVYYELLKRCKTVEAHRYQQQLIKFHRLLSVSRPDYKQRQKRWISFTKTQHHTRQELSKSNWRHSTRICYPMPLVLRTFPLPIITCFNRWATRSLSNTSISTMTFENGLMCGFLQKGWTHFHVEIAYCPIDGNIVYSSKEVTLDKVTRAFYEMNTSFYYQKTADLSLCTW